MKQKSKHKHIPGKRKHQIIIICISVVMLLLIRFQIHFLGDLFLYTGLVDITILFGVSTYAIWLSKRKQIRWLAIELVSITVFSIIIGSSGPSRLPSSVDGCVQESIIIIRCWDNNRCGYFQYLGVDLFPIGIYLNHSYGSCPF